MLRGRLHITQSIFGNFSSPAPPDRRVRNSKPSSADYVICERLISYITKHLKDIGLDKMIDLIFNQ